MAFLDRLLSRFEKKTVDRTIDYFWDAILVFSSNRHPVVRMAALAAAKKARRACINGQIPEKRRFG